MAWRAPVNYSREVFYVRVGLRDVKIRHSFLMQAVEDSIALGEAINKKFDDARKPGSSKSTVVRKTLPNLFLTMDPDLKDIEHGTIHKVVYELTAIIPELAVRLHRLQNITLGESWALRFLLTPGAGIDAAPEAE